MAVRTPGGLGTRGGRLWRDMTAAVRLGPAQLVLLEEACRIADRLDRLDVILSGGAEELATVAFEQGELRLVVDSVLAEARQQATALKGIVAELRQGARTAGATAGETKGGAGVADLTAKIAARRTAAKG